MPGHRLCQGRLRNSAACAPRLPARRKHPPMQVKQIPDLPLQPEDLHSA